MTDHKDKRIIALDEGGVRPKTPLKTTMPPVAPVKAARTAPPIPTASVTPAGGGKEDTSDK